jgi:hypothetical protein
MANIIHFDSAGEGKTGKSTIAVNTAAVLARDYGKTLLIETSDNPGYMLTYSRPCVKKRLFDFDESKSLYAWNTSYIDFVSKKQCMRKEMENSPARHDIMTKLMKEKRISIKSEEDMERAVEKEMDEEAARRVYESTGKGRPLVQDYAVGTNAGFDIVAGRLNQKSMLEELIKSYYPQNIAETDEMLKKSFAKEIKRLSSLDGNDYKYIVVDGRMENDLLNSRMYEAADINIAVLDNSIKTAQSAYTCLPIKIKQIFREMTEKNPLFNMLLQEKSNSEIEDFRKAAEKASQYCKIISLYESKRAKNEEILEDEENIYNRFSRARYDLGALINDKEKYENLAAPMILTNKVLDLERAVRNAKLLGIGLDKKGITANFPEPNDGFITFYNDLMSEEEDKSMPIAVSNPKHGFSKEIKDFVECNLVEQNENGGNN